MRYYCSTPYGPVYYPAHGPQSCGAHPAAGSYPRYSMLLDSAKNGAIVGAVGAAAHNLHEVREDSLSMRQAAINTAKAGLAAGVATAAATAAGNAFNRHPLASLAATLVTGVAVMYAIDEIARKPASNKAAE